MAGIQSISKQVIDYAERASDMADAAQGRNRRVGSTVTRWVVLPVSGAALFALARSNYVSRQAKDVVGGAKNRASELPDDLMTRVRQVANGSTTPTRRSPKRGATASSRKAASRSSSSSSRKRTTARAR
jgi:hypothetical protein